MGCWGEPETCDGCETLEEGICPVCGGAECPECGERMDDDGNAYGSCYYSPKVCDACGWKPCDGSC